MESEHLIQERLSWLEKTQSNNPGEQDFRQLILDKNVKAQKP